MTGATAGVGRAVAEALGRRGCRIGLIARGRDGLEATRTAVEAAGGRALVLPCDVADAEMVAAAAERTERRFGPIDLWINSAMATVYVASMLRGILEPDGYRFPPGKATLAALGGCRKV